MTSAARRWAVGAFGAVAALTVAPAMVAPAPVQAADGEWQVLRWSVDPGDAVAGESWTVTGTISAPMETDSITDVELTLTRVEENDDCPNLTTNVHVRDPRDNVPEVPGGGETSSTSTSMPTTTTTTPVTGLDEYRFRFVVTPRCNGHYQLHVVGTADRIALPDDVSDPIPMGDWNDPENAIAVGLRPPDVASTSATINAANRTMAVQWEPPPGYSASGAPPDFVGYGIDYSPDGGTTWRNGALVEPNVHTASFQLKPNDPAGDYQVRVRGVRRNADGNLQPAVVAAGGTTAVATVTVGAPPVATTTPPTSRPQGGGGGGGGHVAPPGTAPATTVDEGFSETLDYSDLEEGDAEAELPGDASSFLDIIPDSPGSALLVPFAIAECLAVWAFHLRFLARRLEAPITPPTITVDTTRPGRTPTA